MIFKRFCFEWFYDLLCTSGPPYESKLKQLKIRSCWHQKKTIKITFWLQWQHCLCGFTQKHTSAVDFDLLRKWNTPLLRMWWVFCEVLVRLCTAYVVRVMMSHGAFSPHFSCLWSVTHNSSNGWICRQKLCKSAWSPHLQHNPLPYTTGSRIRGGGGV